MWAIKALGIQLALVNPDEQRIKIRDGTGKSVIDSVKGGKWPSTVRLLDYEEAGSWDTETRRPAFHGVNDM